MNSRTREQGNLLVIILCIIALFLLVAAFHTDHNFYDTFNLKGILRLQCGITVDTPKGDLNKKVEFPLAVTGYINGCGWQPNGLSAGTAQIFDGKGLPLTLPTTMAIPADGTKAPQYFEADLTLISAPATDTGNIILRSTTGLLTTIPVAF